MSKNDIAFNKVKIIKEDGTNDSGRKMCLAQCRCGKIIRIRQDSAKNRQSCGCQSNKTHGSSYTRLYNIWLRMKARCYNKNEHCFKWYGGKGVAICMEWQDYIVFEQWAINNGYADDLTIDRLSSNGNYEPSNCEWVTRGENSRRAQTKVSEDEASEICEAHATGKFKMTEIANFLNVSTPLISLIIKRSKDAT